MKSWRTALGSALLGGALLLAQPASAQSFKLTPYVWLPNINGELRFNIPPGAGGSPTVEAGPNDYLENLDMALMIAGEADIGGRVSIFTDLIYLDFSNENAAVRTVNGPGPIQIPVDVGSQLTFKGLEWTLGASVDLVDYPDVGVQGLMGFRYLGPDVRLNWQLDGPLNLLPESGTVEQESDLWDVLIGLRGEGRMGNWVFPYYFDIGTGSSDLTWQALAGVGYRWGWGDLHASYRHLAYDQDENKLLQDFEFSGPTFGATFHF
jgi:hypothetical protein